MPLYTDFLRTHPNFFPSHGNEISVIWDDRTEMNLLLEGTQTINGITFPKQISTPNNTSILGRYLRARLGVSLQHTITRSDLRRYGREDIDVTYDSTLNIYYFDFHI